MSLDPRGSQDPAEQAHCVWFPPKRPVSSTGGNFMTNRDGNIKATMQSGGVRVASEGRLRVERTAMGVRDGEKTRVTTRMEVGTTAWIQSRRSDTGSQGEGSQEVPRFHCSNEYLSA